MKIAAILVVLAFFLFPVLASAECMGAHPDESATNCMPGLVWDADTGICVAKPIS